MKIISRAVLPTIMCVLILALVISYFLRGTGAVGVANWASATEGHFRYSEMYEIGNCTGGLCICIIDVYRDGTGVEIAAMDRGWRDDYALWQNIRIIKDPGSDEVAVETKYRMVPKIKGFTIAIESAYDIFAKKCREDAQWLPPEVKKFFFGQYGIE